VAEEVDTFGRRYTEESSDGKVIVCMQTALACRKSRFMKVRILPVPRRLTIELRPGNISGDSPESTGTFKN
jgi:hypothetical protein